MYNIAICDDDQEYRKYLISLLKRVYQEPVCIYEYSSGKELLSEVRVFHDLVFIDIQMKTMDGHETARRLRKQNRDTLLVFCSGSQQPSAEFFKVSPFRYLLKQHSEEKTIGELEAIVAKMTTSANKHYMLVPYGIDNGMVKISTDDILYISVVKRGCHVNLVPEVKKDYPDMIIVKEKISGLYEQLCGDGFGRAHNSYIVNFKYIQKFNKMDVVLSNGESLTISRSKYEQFRQEFTDFFGKKYSERMV